MLSRPQCKGYAGGRSTHNAIIERFWIDHNANDMVHFRDEFEILENLRFLEADNSVVI